MKDNSCYIYALVDPITFEIKYIGESINPINRYRQHLRYSSWNVSKWIGSLKTTNRLPKMITLEICTKGKAR